MHRTTRAARAWGLLALALSLAASAVALTVPAASAAPAATSTWFHDPLTHGQRAALVPVPSRPAAVHGQLRGTQALYRTAAGGLAVPVSWARGHQLTTGQSVVLDGTAIVGRRTTAATRRQVAQLAASLTSVAAVRCEGYSTYGVPRARAQKLALQWAVRVCNLLASSGHGPRTTSTGYGARLPILVGGTRAQRARNNRVIVSAVAVRATKPPAPKPPTHQTTAPGAPTLTSVTGGIGTITMTFTAPTSTGGSPITGYQWSTDKATWNPLTLTGSSPYSATLTALPPGLLTYYVRALNSVGAGAPSSGVTGSVLSAPTAPGAPTLTSVTGGIGSMLLGFTAPISTGGSPITGYQWSTDKATWNPLTLTGSSPYSATLTALPPGLLTYYVRALNSVGAGAPSTGVTGSVLSAPTAPGAPTLTSVTGGIGTMLLGFTAPISTGGSPITGYQWSTDKATWNPLTLTGSSPYSATLTALPPGLLTYYVRALNSVGAGAPSTGLTGSVLSAPTAPGAPTLTSVTGGIGTMLLGFTAPISTGGSPITGYQWSTDKATWNPLTLTGSSPYSATLTALPPGLLTYYVRALNSVGAGAPSTGLTGTVLSAPTAPGAPTLTSVTGGIGTMLLGFTAPISTGGSPITGYQWSTDKATWNPLTLTGSSPYSATLTALPPGLLTYYVRALNSVGAGAPSTGLTGSVLSAPTAPGAPTLTSVTGGIGTITMTFTAPTSTGGSPITGYQWSTDKATWNPLTLTGSSPYSATLTALPPGLLTYYVRALNSVGAGAPSSGVTGSVLSAPTAPGAPTLTSVTGGIGSMLLGFTAPISTGGSPITGYQWSTDKATWNPLTLTGSSPYSATLTALPPGLLTYYVRALNSVGAGAPSTGVTGSVLSAPTAPGAPTLTSVTGGIGTMLLGFTAPISTGGSPITGYQWSTDKATWNPLTLTGSSPYSATLTALPPGLLTYYVRALNSVGAGAPSTGLTGTVLSLLPASPLTGVGGA